MIWLELWVLCGLVGILLLFYYDKPDYITVSDFLCGLFALVLGPISLVYITACILEEVQLSNIVIWRRSLDK